MTTGTRPVGQSDIKKGRASAATSATKSVTPGGRIRNVAALVGPPLGVFIVILGVWLFVSYVVLDRQRRFLLPPPQGVMQDGLLDGDSRSTLLSALWTTATVALVGLLIAMLIGVVVAVLMSQARWVERSFYPYAVILQTMPILALVPLVSFWWGFNFRSRVLVCVLFALFPVITNTLFGLKSVERGMHDLFTLHRASRRTRLWKLQLPAALPAMFTGFRIAGGMSVIGAIVADFFFRQGQPGIGRLLDVYRANLQAGRLFAAIFLSSMLGIVVFWLLGFLGNRIVGSWHGSLGSENRG